MKSLITGLAILGVALSAPALARQDDPRLDQLFGQLQIADDPTAIEQSIWTIWLESGSDTTDLLLKRGTAAMQAREFEDALSIFTTVVERDPAFAEGWNKRATLLFLMGRYPESIADIEMTTDLEPRHFGALSGLGMIRSADNDMKGALEAYRRVLEVHPNNPNAGQIVKELEKEVEGRGI